MLSLQVKGEFFLQVSYYTLVMFLYLYDKKMELERLFPYFSLPTEKETIKIVS